MRKRYGAAGGNRTRTLFPVRVFETLASACSATAAYHFQHIYYNILFPQSQVFSGFFESFLGSRAGLEPARTGVNPQHVFQFHHLDKEKILNLHSRFSKQDNPLFQAILFGTLIGVNKRVIAILSSTCYSHNYLQALDIVLLLPFSIYGGGGRIRTCGPFRTTAFPRPHHKPDSDTPP